MLDNAGVFSYNMRHGGNILPFIIDDKTQNTKHKEQNTMNHSALDKSFNIQTMKLQEAVEEISPPLFVRGTKTREKFVIRGCPRPGRTSSYPWKDPEYQTGDWFFKQVTYEDWISGKGRPNVPNSKSMGNRVWRTSKAFMDDSKQYGYHVERIS